jgi:hypothetical protein
MPGNAYGRMATVAVFSLLAAAAQAQDAVVLTSGETAKGRVLRYSNHRFVIMVSNQVRDVRSDEVQSIFCDVDEARPQRTAAPPAPAPTATNAAALPADTAPEKAASPKAKPTQAAAPGPAVATCSIVDLKARSGQFDGKVVKVEFLWRGPIRHGQDDTYVVALSDGRASLDVTFDQKAFTWFNQLPDQEFPQCYPGMSRRTCHLYGIVASGAGSCTVTPIGRKTRKGLKGTEYSW